MKNFNKAMRIVEAEDALANAFRRVGCFVCGGPPTRVNVWVFTRPAGRKALYTTCFRHSVQIQRNVNLIEAIIAALVPDSRPDKADLIHPDWPWNVIEAAGSEVANPPRRPERTRRPKRAKRPKRGGERRRRKRKGGGK